MPRFTLLAAEMVLDPRPVSCAAVPTSLSVWAAPCTHHQHVQFSIRETQRAPHRELERDLIMITATRALVERTARRVVSVSHHLHVAMEQGGSVRLRKAGTFRSAWQVDLLRGTGILCSWPVEPRTIEQLDALDLILERAAQPSSVSGGLAALSDHMREVDADLRREHQVDEFIRENLEMPTDEFLEALKTRGLLDPA